tara:strand:- start:3799 stop:4098 length:300 start_codon:yes stop_codon:yes gene_type:complete
MKIMKKKMIKVLTVRNILGNVTYSHKREEINMLKLKKVNSSKWEGNGMGISKADWVVCGFENIIITNFAGEWHAKDSDKRIASAYTRKELIEILSNKLY